MLKTQDSLIIQRIKRGGLGLKNIRYLRVGFDLVPPTGLNASITRSSLVVKLIQAGLFQVLNAHTYPWKTTNEPSVFDKPKIIMPKSNSQYEDWKHRDIDNMNGMKPPVSQSSSIVLIDRRRLAFPISSDNILDGPIPWSGTVRLRINWKYRNCCVLYRHWCANVGIVYNV